MTFRIFPTKLELAAIASSLSFLMPSFGHSAPKRSRRTPSRGSAQPNCRADLRHRVRRGAVAFIYPANRT